MSKQYTIQPLWALSLALFIIFQSHLVLAQTKIQGISISANEIFRDLEKKTIDLEGNVKVNYQGQSFLAEKARLHLDTKRITASGKVIVTNQDVYAEGTNIDYNYETQLGVFEKAFVQSGQVIFEGETIEKVGPRDYIAKNASYTACATCPPAWSFTGSVIEAELGGYAYIRFPVLKIANFPVFFLPGILVPLKSERQSGLLVPAWGTSKEGGFEIEQSYFWAINESNDATFSMKSYSKRGYKGLAEYRYMLSEESSGTLNTAYIHDQVYDRLDGEDGNRWFIKYHHYYKLPNNYVQRMEINIASDIDYIDDFPDELPGLGDPALENKASITKNWDNAHFSTETAYYINLLKDSRIDDNDDAVHRFPEIKYSYLLTPLMDSNFHFKIDTNYVNFSRNTFSFDDVNTSVNSEVVKPDNDGEFDPNSDILRTGTRLNIEPTVSYPVLLGRTISLQPSLTFRHTHYLFNTDNPTSVSPNPSNQEYSKSATRQYLKTDLSAKTEFSRVYNIESGPQNKGTFIQHKIVPSIEYSRIPQKNNDNHVFFGNFLDKRFDRTNDPIEEQDFFNHSGPSQGPGEGKVQFDYDDRLFKLEIVKWELENIFVRKKWVGEKPIYKTMGSLKLWQYYDINEYKASTDNDPKAWTSLNSILFLSFDKFETYTYAKHYPYAQVTDLSTRVKWFSPLGNFIQTTYAKTHKVQDDYTVPIGSITENIGFEVGVSTKYFNLLGQIDYSLRPWQTQNWGYTAQFKPPGNCWSFQVSQTKEVGDDDVKTNYNVSFNFGGDSVL